MSTTGTERHCRLCLMLNKGGTQACHHLLLKRVKELSPKDHDPYPWTVQQFLDTKKQEIIKSNMSKKKFKILFPDHGDTVLTTWDLSLFCTVLTLYCDLKSSMRVDVDQLRKRRNELCHMNEPNISVSEYEDKLDNIQVTISRLVEKLDDLNVKREICNVIKNLESATLSLDETLKEMHAFYVMEMDISEKLDHVGESILQKLEQFDDTRELIRKMLGESSRISTVPGVKIVLDFKNVSDDEEAKMSDVLQQLFEEVIHEENDFKSSIPAESYVRLRGAIKKTFERFLSKGWKITGVIHECIQIHIVCTNFTALAALLREQTHGLIDQQLTELNEALTECVSEKMLLLETTIYTDELWNVIDKAISCVEDVLKEHNIDMATQSDNAQLVGDDIRKHSLSLTAEKVGSDGSGSFEGDCNNKLETFLQLLKAELKSEFHTPNLLIQANCSTNVNHVSNDSSIDNKVELLEEQEHTLTIGSDYQSPKFDKKEKENIIHFQVEEVEYVERIFKELSLKDIEQKQMGTLVKQEEHSSGEKIEITSQVRKDISTAISSASTATDLKEVETEGALHKNALHAIVSSLNAISVYYELASLTLIERDPSFLDNIFGEMEKVQDIVGCIIEKIANTAHVMCDISYGSVKDYTELCHNYRIRFEIIETAETAALLNDSVQEVLKELLVLKVPAEQMKNQSKAAYDHLHHLQQLCKDEERLLKEWQRDLKETVPLSKEETKQREEAEHADIKGDKVQSSGTHLAGDKKRIYDDLGTSKMLTQDKIRLSEIHSMHAKDMALKDYDEKTQQALTEMLRPGPALLVQRTDQTFDEQTIKSHYNILVSDQLFERDSNIAKDIKAFLSELTSHRETKLIEDPKQEGKIEQASSVFLKKPSEDELKLTLNQKKGKYLKESGTIKVQDKEISTSALGQDQQLWTESLQLRGKIEQASSVFLKQPSEDELKLTLNQKKGKDLKESGTIKVQDQEISTSALGQDKQLWTESLQLRGKRIALWCIQRIQAHSECMTVQMKRIQISKSQIHRSLLHIKSTIPKSLDRSTLLKEWFKVFKVTQHCDNSLDILRDKQKLYVHLDCTEDEREKGLMSILKEMETNL